MLECLSRSRAGDISPVIPCRRRGCRLQPIRPQVLAFSDACLAKVPHHDPREHTVRSEPGHRPARPWRVDQASPQLSRSRRCRAGSWMGADWFVKRRFGARTAFVQVMWMKVRLGWRIHRPPPWGDCVASTGWIHRSGPAVGPLHVEVLQPVRMKARLPLQSPRQSPAPHGLPTTQSSSLRRGRSAPRREQVSAAARVANARASCRALSDKARSAWAQSAWRSASAVRKPA